VGILGPIEVRLGDEVARIPSGRATQVLARLALEPGAPVRVDRLIEDVWAGAAAATARNTLQSKVSQLRRALGAGVVVGGGDTYTLAIGPEQVDAVVAERAAERAAAARRVDDAEAALAVSTEGLELFRGEVLGGAGDADWVAAPRVRLEEVRLRLVEDRLWARIELGAGGEVVPELESLVQAHPVREALWVLLISALYRSGRQADALAAYGRVRSVLVEELGIEPGPSLRELEVRVLQQDPELGALPPGDPSAVPGNLPRRTGPLVGRDADVRRIVEAVGSCALVTVVGPAGVGKTRLAVEVAHELRAPGGVWLVRLDAVDGPGVAVAQAVAEAMHLPDEAALSERLAGSPTVVVLDNCEHVVDAAAGLVDRLLDAAPSLRVLATSQVPLALGGELVEVLEPLPLDASVELFSLRAAATRPGAALDDSAASVEEVCRALDGLPLAIELAAARVRSLSVPEIARRLEERFVLLRDPAGRGPERRRALAGAIAWSYDLLFPDDQRGLWAMAVFVGGAPIGAIEHVLRALDVPAEASVDVIDRLVERSLVGVEERPDGELRYRPLDSIRAFAVERLVESGLRDEAALAHAEWFAAQAATCDADVRGPGQARAMAVARDERANVDAALSWSAVHAPTLGLQIANGMAWTWVVLGDGAAGAARLRGAAVAAPDAPVDDLARALLGAGWLEASAGDVAVADADLDRAAGLAERSGDPGLLADVHRHRAFVRIQQGRPADVLSEADAALAIDRADERSWQVAGSLLLSAFGSIMLGDAATAGHSAQEAVALLVPVGDSWGLVHAAAMLGAVAELEGRPEVAAEALERAAAESERVGFLGQAALHLTSLGRVRRTSGDPLGAAATLEEALVAAGRGGDLRIAATARVELARARSELGDRDEAIRLVREADEWYRTAGGDGTDEAAALLAELTAP
jgi:predicted ATPase/DNA-binding SARP family transcriptional activator